LGRLFKQDTLHLPLDEILRLLSNTCNTGLITGYRLQKIEEIDIAYMSLTSIQDSVNHQD